MLEPAETVDELQDALHVIAAAATDEYVGLGGDGRVARPSARWRRA